LYRKKRSGPLFFFFFFFLFFLFFPSFLTPLCANFLGVAYAQIGTYDVSITIEVGRSIRFAYLVVFQGPTYADEVRENLASGIINESDVRNILIERIVFGVNATPSNIGFKIENLANKGADLIYNLSCEVKMDLRFAKKFAYRLIVPPWENTTLRIVFPSYIISAQAMPGDGVTGYVKGNYVTYRFLKPNLYVLNVTFKKPPPTPVTLSVPSPDDITEDSVKLKWTGYTDPDFQRYEVYRSNMPGSLGELVSTIRDASINTCAVTGLEPGSSHYFTIRVVDIEGLTSDSNQILVKTKAPLWAQTWFHILIIVVAMVIAAAATIGKRRGKGKGREGKREAEGIRS
jgi:hypothetical protein